MTFGAGGTTREGSLELARQLARGHGLEVLPYFACWGLGPDEIGKVVDDYAALGVENMLLVRGDEPRGEGAREPHPASLAHASDLVAYLRPRYDLCFGVAGYPEGHVQSESRERDIEFLKLKVERGAEFVIANYFYDNDFYFDFVDRCRAAGVDVPILPGVMPIFSLKMMRNLAALCGATITARLEARLAALPEGDKKALAALGIEIATEQCRGLLSGGAPGVHVYTMDRSKATVAIVKALREEGLL